MTEPAWIDAAEWLEMARELRNDRWQLADLCGLDARDLGFEHRFEAVIQLVNYDRKGRRTVHVRATGDPPTVPSVAEVWPTANFMEREAYDLLGIVFEGHPKLTRILMPDEWEGHPLRKDYGVGKVAIEFIPQPFLQLDSPGQMPDPPESKVEVDGLGQVRSNGRERS